MPNSLREGNGMGNQTSPILEREERLEQVRELNLNNKPIVWMDGWSIATAKSDSDDGGGNRNGTSWRLCGHVPEHHKLIMHTSFDHHIETSRILMFDSLTKTAETRNTFYILGDIDGFWQKILDQNGQKIEEYNFDRREIHETNRKIPADPPAP
jgi:hypothetical protein